MTRILGSVHTYDNGQARVEFCWNGERRDGYAWSVTRQQRLASYPTRRATAAALAASTNTLGPYGCARLMLADEADAR